MTYGFKIVQEMISGLENWMDERGYARLDELIGKAVPNVTDWQYLNLNYIAKAQIDQDKCIKCGRCYAACEDTSHQAISKTPKNGKRHFEVIDEECVACNLCIEVCPVEKLHHHGAADGGRRSAHRAARSIRTMPTGRRIPTIRRRRSRRSSC